MNKIKTLRIKHGLSQHSAAKIVHVSQRVWARYEAGEKKPPEGLLELLCMKLGEKYPSALEGS